jgi:type IV secretory pathway VirB2 component (pilin)
MNKKFLIVTFFCLISIMLVPLMVSAQTGDPLVKCGNAGQNPCTLGDVLILIDSIYSFIVYTIATPLAVLALIVGGILLLTSAGNPTLAGLGKKTLWAAIIGLVLVFGAKAIIDFVKTLVGYT